MLESGTLLLNRYEILKPIGQGGMGAVYQARDQRLGNTVALKETFFTDSILLSAFEREARLLAGLRHPALPKVIDHFADDNGQFLVMEFIPGDDLQDLLTAAKRAFQPEDVLQWADQILDALDYLHSQDPPIIHRDIKPQNVKLTSRNQVVLLDFGLAKSVGGANATAITNSGQSIFAYTPNYAPLEQIQGAGTDAQSDLYSLGATLYHLMTGVRPVDALTRASAVLNGKADPLTPACSLNPLIPPDVSAVVTQAMSLNRDRRPATAVVMRRMMRNATPASPGDSAVEGRTVLTQQGVKPILNPLPSANELTGQIVSHARSSAAGGLKTDSKGSPPSPTVSKPAEAKITRPNALSQKARSTTPAWPAPSGTTREQVGGSQGKLIAIAVVLLLVATVTILILNKGQAKPEVTPPPVQNGGETLKVATQPEAQGSPTPTVAEIPKSDPALAVSSDRDSKSEADTPPPDEDVPSSKAPAAPQKIESSEPRQVETMEEKTPQSETRPGVTSPQQRPEQERRPPPPPPDAQPRHPRPPPPHGMPPPRRRP